MYIITVYSHCLIVRLCLCFSKMFCFLDQNIMTTQLHLVTLKWEQDRVRCSAAQVDRLERACRLQLARCALLNKASRFMTPPLGILILILFLALSHFHSLCLFCHKMLRTLFSFVYEFPLCLSPCLSFQSRTPECWRESQGTTNARGVGVGGQAGLTRLASILFLTLTN